MNRLKLNVKLPNADDDRNSSFKRSACRKIYCECCRMNSPCKCIGCDHIQGPFLCEVVSHSQNMSAKIHPVDKADCKGLSNHSNSHEETESEAASIQTEPSKNEKNTNFTVKTQPVVLNVIHENVAEASIECMLAQAYYCVQMGLNEAQTEKMILEEFDRYLAGTLASLEITEEATGQVSS